MKYFLLTLDFTGTGTQELTELEGGTGGHLATTGYV